MYINAGHNPPLLLREDGTSEFLSHGGLPLGAFEDARYSESVAELREGDVLVLYTDGVVEARNADGLFYPFTERVPEWTKDDPDELLRHLQDDLLSHVHGHLNDDAAVVAIRRLAV